MQKNNNYRSIIKKNNRAEDIVGTQLRSKRNTTTINDITGPYNIFEHPSTVITIVDNSAKERVKVTSSNWGVFQPIYAPKGPTDKLITIEGDDVLGKYEKLFGLPNTRMYGPMGTYAYRALEGKFTLGTLNIRSDEATFPNWYVGLDITGADQNQAVKTKTCFIAYDDVENYYHMGFNQEDIPEELQDEQNTIELPILSVGFDKYSIEGLGYISDFDEYLGDAAVGDSLGDGTVVGIDNHIPVFGLAYLGRGSYGNIFKSTLSNTGVLINDLYPQYNMVTKDKTVKEHALVFSTFDIQHDYESMLFADQVREKCVMTCTEINKIDLFHGFNQSRTHANKITKLMANAVDIILKEAVIKITELYPQFNVEDNNSDFDLIANATQSIVEMFSATKEMPLKAIETPLSYVNILEDIDAEDALFEFKPCPSILKMDCGYEPLEEVLAEDGFSFDLEIERTLVDIDGEEYKALYKPITQALLDIYRGNTDEGIFDSHVLQDALMLGDRYPLEVQEAMFELCRYKEDVINDEHVRVNLAYFRTPQEGINTMEDVLNWSRSHSAEKNLNCHTMIGTWRFPDEFIGAQERYQGYYDWFGLDSPLYAYLSSGTSDSFASGTYSAITTGTAGTQELVPTGTSYYRELLYNRDIMYYNRRTNGTYCLGADTGHYIDFESAMKSVGSNLVFNHILTIAHGIMRDNQIIYPSSTNLKVLAEKVENAIKPYTSHFAGGVQVNCGLSTELHEEGKSVVLLEVIVQGNVYSRKNRVKMVIENGEVE